MRRSLSCWIGGTILLGWANFAQAQMGGLGLYEVGGGGTGNANAGFAANATDASISYFNPASMTLMEGHHFLAGVQAAYVDLTFAPGPLTDVDGTDGGNAGGFVPGGGLYFVFSASDRVKLGFALNVPWGAQTLYDEDWVGRYHVYESTLLGVNFNPSVGVRITDWVSVGAGVQLYYFHFDQKIAVNTPAGQITGRDGLVNVGGGDLTVGAVVGTTFEPTPSTTIGVVYRSPIQVDITGNAEATNFGPVQDLIPGPKALELGMTMPMAVDVSVKQDLLDGQLSLLFDAGWANARSFSQNFFTVGNVSGDIERNFQDTWRVAGGAHYWAAPNWMLQTGYSFDSSPVSDENRTPDLPTGALHRVALGTQVDVNQTVRLGGHYALGIGGDMGMDAPPIIPGSGRVQGEYNNTLLHFFLFTVAVHWGGPESSTTEEPS